jgi:transposase
MVEQWICSECGAEHERDANAAINLRGRWLRLN